MQGYADNMPLIGSDHVNMETMPPNTGAVVNDWLKKVAVYKDEQGVLRKFAGTDFVALKS